MEDDKQVHITYDYEDDYFVLSPTENTFDDGVMYFSSKVYTLAEAIKIFKKKVYGEY